MTPFRNVLERAAIDFVSGAMFPKYPYWPGRLGWRGLLAWIAFNTAQLFAFRTWALPYLRRQAEVHKRAREELRHQLGREPTPDEVLAHLGITTGR